MVPCSDLAPLVQTTVVGGTNVNLYKEPSTIAFAEVAPKPITPDTQFMYYYYESDVEDDDEVTAVTEALVEAIIAAGFSGGMKPADALKSVTKMDGPAAANATANGTTVAEIPLPLGVTVVAKRRSDSGDITSDASATAGWLSTARPGAVAEVYTRDGEKTSRIISALVAAAAEDAKAVEAAAAAVPAISEGLNSVVKAAAGMEPATDDDGK